MERSGALPDRCVVCNADAGGYRLSRKLYCSPFLWRLCATATPFTVAGIGGATQTPLLILLFWPLVLALMLAHVFVRRKVELDLGVCARHRRLRAALRTLSIACLVGVLASIPVWAESDSLGAALLWSSIAGLLCLSLAQSYTGVQSISVSRLDAEHAWLARTGKTFRAALPELPG
jgi:peptidoglycan/LPS O-acetylase OafA/YrhL